MAKKGGEEEMGKEGRNLLGPPSFKELENGRFKCVETGHELPAHAKDSYAQSKHCRMGLIDAALAHRKPPLNMFQQDPNNRSKLICKLTGDTVNKSEEHIWKHINGRRFLNKLEQMEAEKLTPNGILEEKSEQTPQKISKPKADGLKKKKKKNKAEENVGKVILEVRKSSDKDSDSEEAEFWIPPMGDPLDLDDEGTEHANGADAATEEGNGNAGELSKRTKRMSIEIGPSNFASQKKKKKKTKST
ncbi:uncharacterized protein LOC132284841 [Cornus florida]|uniref:uncharacterized protein LOC132284841 n=1 Tax=Cornus florida TaxID=4283 RepID=UPI00289FDFB8|nr:uncharacterized protein LOC132284841 [Cornus florida]